MLPAGAIQRMLERRSQDRRTRSGTDRNHRRGQPVQIRNGSGDRCCTSPEEGPAAERAWRPGSNRNVLDNGRPVLQGLESTASENGLCRCWTHRVAEWDLVIPQIRTARSATALRLHARNRDPQRRIQIDPRPRGRCLLTAFERINSLGAGLADSAIGHHPASQPGDSRKCRECDVQVSTSRTSTSVRPLELLYYPNSTPDLLDPWPTAPVWYRHG